MGEDTKKAAAATTPLAVEELVEAAVRGVMRALEARGEGGVLRQDQPGVEPKPPGGVTPEPGERPPTWVGIILPQIPEPEQHFTAPQPKPAYWPNFPMIVVNEPPVTWVGILLPRIEDLGKPINIPKTSK